VNPTRSQNNTEHTRRSATGPTAVAAKTRDPAATASAVPHSPQNLCPAGLAVLHEPQTSASAAPHSPQNFWPDGLSAEHRGQIILREGYRSPAGPEKASKTAGPEPRRAGEDCPPGAHPRRRRARRFGAGLPECPPPPVDEPGDPPRARATRAVTTASGLPATRQPPQPTSHNRVICAGRASDPGHYCRVPNRSVHERCPCPCHPRYSAEVTACREISAVRPGLRLNADHEAGRPDLGILCVDEPGGQGSLAPWWGLRAGQVSRGSPGGGWIGTGCAAWTSPWTRSDGSARG